jgi:uncharacterized protein YbjT (DUF2867 family)
METILVTGASGRTGRRIIGKLVRDNRRVRAFVRRPEVVTELESLGVAECVVGTLEREADLARAIDGADIVLHVCPPMHPQEDAIAKTMIRLSVASGVTLFALYSVLHPVIDVPHHRRKLEAEQALIDSGLPYVILQPCRYMQHLNAIWQQVLADGIHAMPFSTQSRFSLVDLEDVAEATARVLGDAGHAYATYQLAGPDLLSMQDCAARISAALGREVTAEARSEEEFCRVALASGFPAERIANMTIMNAHYTAHGLAGNAHVLKWILGREPTRFDGFLRRELVRAPQDG